MVGAEYVSVPPDLELKEIVRVSSKSGGCPLHAPDRKREAAGRAAKIRA